MTTTMQEIERLFTESEENERAQFELIMQDYETACETACEYKKTNHNERSEYRALKLH